MKKGGLLLILLCVLSIMGCAAKTNSNPESESKKKEEKKEQIESEETDSKQDIDNQQKEESGTDSVESESEQSETYTITIYYSNDNADGLNSEKVEVEMLTPQILMRELGGKKVVPSDIAVVNCVENSADGEKVLDLDLTKNFSDYLANFGTAGETMTIKAVSNTFLEAYNCKKIRITVEGESLATGHAEYSGYMNRFENN